jgi:hypothetical protein
MAATPGPSGPQAVSALTALLAQAVAEALSRPGGTPARVAESRAVRSTWGAFRPTLSGAAHSIVLPGVPGGVVVDPDQALAGRAEMARAASAAIRRTLTPRGRGQDGAAAERARLAEEVGVLVLAFELRQAGEVWRLRVCLPSNTLKAVLGALAPPPTAPPLLPSAEAVSPRTEVLRELARQDPAALSDLISRWLAEDPER